MKNKVGQSSTKMAVSISTMDRGDHQKPQPGRPTLMKVEERRLDRGSSLGTVKEDIVRRRRACFQQKQHGGNNGNTVVECDDKPAGGASGRSTTAIIWKRKSVWLTPGMNELSTERQVLSGECFLCSQVGHKQGQCPMREPRGECFQQSMGVQNVGGRVMQEMEHTMMAQTRAEDRRRNELRDGLAFPSRSRMEQRSRQQGGSHRENVLLSGPGKFGKPQDRHEKSNKVASHIMMTV